jgi:GDP-L-fucose synthase
MKSSNKILKFFDKKKILVTGGTGLIGRFVVSKLLNFNAKVTVVSLDDFLVDKSAKHIKGDLTNFEFCKKITRNIDYAFHLSGIKGSVKVTIEKPASFFVPLLMMNTNFLEACRLNNVNRLVYTSSIGAYSSREVFIENEEDINKPPMDMFPGWAKRMAEMQIKAYKKQYNLNNFFVVRPCNVYGPGDNFDPENAMVIPTLMNRIFKKEDPVIIWGDGSAVRDFAYAGDIADGIILAIVKGTGNFDFLNLGSGNGYTIKELVETLSEVVNFNYRFDKTKDTGFPKRIMDINNAKKILDYSPKISLKEGLKETWSWYINNSNQNKKRHNYFK